MGGGRLVFLRMEGGEGDGLVDEMGGLKVERVWVRGKGAVRLRVVVGGVEEGGHLVPEWERGVRVRVWGVARGRRKRVRGRIRDIVVLEEGD